MMTVNMANIESTLNEWIKILYNLSSLSFLSQRDYKRSDEKVIKASDAMQNCIKLQ